MRYGLSLVVDESQRATGAELAVRFAAMTWKEAMATLTELAVPYVHRFQALLDVVPLADQPLVSFMVDQVKAVVSIAERLARASWIANWW